jgi:hypothetical protein
MPFSIATNLSYEFEIYTHFVFIQPSPDLFQFSACLIQNGGVSQDFDTILTFFDFIAASYFDVNFPIFSYSHYLFYFLSLI